MGHSWIARTSGPPKALRRLAEQIGTADDESRYPFTREGYLHTGGEPAMVDSFEIHRMKIDPLAHRLVQHGLAWEVRRHREDRHDWLAVVPTLAEVIMSSLAIAIADYDGLCIVTPSEQAYAITRSAMHEHALEQLLGTIPRPDIESEAELLQTVMHSVIWDVQNLTVKQIKDLLDRREDLISLRTALQEMAQRIPPMHNKRTRAARVREAARDVISDWQKKENTVRVKVANTVDAGDSIYDIGEALIKLEFIKSAIKGVTFLFKLAKGEREGHTRRYNFLNLVENYGGPQTSSLFLPAFGKLGTTQQHRACGESPQRTGKTGNFASGSERVNAWGRPDRRIKREGHGLSLPTVASKVEIDRLYTQEEGEERRSDCLLAWLASRFLPAEHMGKRIL